MASLPANSGEDLERSLQAGFHPEKKVGKNLFFAVDRGFGRSSLLFWDVLWWDLLRGTLGKFSGSIF